MNSEPHPPHPAPIPFAEPWEYELAFPRDPRGPGIARTTLRAVLVAHGLDELLHRAELLTSELTTNSVRYSRGPASVRLHWAYPVLRVSVLDSSPHLPAPGSSPVPPGCDSERGRGLLIIGLVADKWGGCAIGDSLLGPGGKTVWFELVWDAGPPPPDAVAALAA
ncbi:ATP-binding protein [Streptomyces sp. MST-110588]|uniref:ATP-binding protein n=1 Tax=Streptomyces sp. MST-110588 TaxID=2833628 RepID=UPI001F5DD16C|nr:ATP-binding protein [Streptomyces sp. MST-110588]UNO39796.1 ATP-binding protein [Streptomyces sp. MST-110588]